MEIIELTKAPEELNNFASSTVAAQTTRIIEPVVTDAIVNQVTSTVQIKPMELNENLQEPENSIKSTTTAHITTVIESVVTDAMINPVVDMIYVTGAPENSITTESEKQSKFPIETIIASVAIVEVGPNTTTEPKDPIKLTTTKSSNENLLIEPLTKELEKESEITKPTDLSSIGKKQIFKY